MSSIRNSPLYPAARQLLRRLALRDIPPSTSLRDAIEPVADSHARLARNWRLLQTAERRGWRVAAGRLRDELTLDARNLHDRVDELVRRSESFDRSGLQENPRPLQPSLALLIDELRQLEDEFEQVRYELRERRIIAHTEPIELDGLALGRFAIELHLDRFGHGPEYSCFRCTALDPNPASSNASVTHPHVQDGGLCAGDATVPIATALRQGRICDAFCLVRAVLQEYNPHSPYVSIEDWDGVRCHDCEGGVDRDDLNYCEGCSHEVCSDCYSCCEICNSGCCNGCLEEDPVSHRSCCSSCRHICATCNRTVDSDSFVEETKLCPECEVKRKELKEAETTPPTPEEIDHDDSHESSNESSESGSTVPACDATDDAASSRVPNPSRQQAPIPPPPATLDDQHAAVPVPDLLPAGLAQAPVVPARRRHRSRRVRHQQPA